MQRAFAPTFILGIGLIIVAAVGIVVGPRAAAQSGPGWISLLDGKTMGDWDRVGQSNWRLENGAVVADKKTGKSPAYLVSKKSYKDFMLHVEFWPSHDANSGIFLRCLDAKKIGDRTCYEVNIFDQRKDPSYGTGAITRYVEVQSDAEGGRQMEHLRDHHQGARPHGGAQRQADGEAAQRHVPVRAVRAPAWCRRDQVPQGRDQADVARLVRMSLRPIRACWLLSIRHGRAPDA